MNDVVIQSLLIIIPIGALILGLHYFHTKQMNALEDRLRDDIQNVDDRLRADIKAVAESVETAKSELRGEIATAKSELRAEIANLAQTVEKGNSDINHRLDRTDDKVSRLIQGAVLGVSVETGPREPVATS